MPNSKPFQKTAGGLAAVNEIPDVVLQDRIISFLKTKRGGTCKIDTLAGAVYRHGQFKHRGKNIDELYSRIWDNVEKLLKKNVIVQHETKTMIKVKLTNP